MDTTRKLSLTLLLVAPLIAAQENRVEDLSLSSVSGEHLPDGVRPHRPHEEYDDQEEIGTSTTMGGAEEKLGRQRRGSSAEDMEVAEQVVFRPFFRNSQILADRKQSKEVVSGPGLDAPTASGQAYYPYQYNYYYPF